MRCKVAGRRHLVKVLYRSCIVWVMSEDAPLRIGELSRRAGVSPELLRAWERRYDLLHPTRSPGGLRLYSLDDLERVRLMSRHIAEGLAAREAAALARRASLSAEPTTPPRTGVHHHTLRSGVRSSRARANHGGLRRTRRSDGLGPATRGCDSRRAAGAGRRSLPPRTRRALGARRALGGPGALRVEPPARTAARARSGLGSGGGPRALLACPPGERHDLGLIVFGLALRNRGWRIDFLGSDTPTTSLVDAARAIQPALLVISATAQELCRRCELSWRSSLAATGSRSQAPVPAVWIRLPPECSC